MNALTPAEQIRRHRTLLENQDSLSMIQMMTQGLRFLKNMDVKEVQVEYKEHPHSQQKACFNNAFKALSSNPQSHYVLGYLVYQGVPIEHAWIKQGSTYLDVTLDPKKQNNYFSVAEFTLEEIMPYVNKHHSAPSLYDMNRFFADQARHQSRNSGPKA